MEELTYEQKEKLAEELNGTSGVYDEAFAKEYGVEVSDLEELVAEHVFRCSQCGWWVEADEANDSDDGSVCNDCNDEE